MIIKTIKLILATLLILIIICIPLSIYLVRFNNNSFIGRNIKKQVIKDPKLVEILNLDEPGDGRYVYSDPAIPSVSVSIYSVDNKPYNERITLWVEDIMHSTVNKKIGEFYEGDINYGKTELLTDESLEEIYKLIKSDSKSDLYIIFTGSYAEKPSSVGLVIKRDAIFIFNDAIDLLSEKGYVRDLLEKTTIMHEWGHLLGLEHINYSNCIMNEMAEVYDNPPVGKNLPTKYCWEELNNIKN